MFNFDALLGLADQLRTVLCVARDNEAARESLVTSAGIILDELANALQPAAEPTLEDDE